MKGILKFIFIFSAILLLSALLAPFLFKALPKLSEILSGFTPLAPDAFQWKFERIYNRLVMIFSLAAIIYAVRAKMLQFPGETIRWNPPASFRLFKIGFIAGFLTLVCVLIIKYLLGLVQFDVKPLGPAGWAERIFMSLLSGLIIGLIEECFFRGFIFHTLFKRFKFKLAAALIVTNLFYSIIHFVNAKKPFIGPDPTFFDSLKLVQAPFISLLKWQEILPGATGLFIFGVILSLVYLQTRSLYACMGLHAGCVFFLKIDGGFTFHEHYLPLVFGSSQCYDGLLGWVILLLMGFLIMWVIRKNKLNVAWTVIFAVVALTAFGPGVYAQESGAEEKKLSAVEMWRLKKEQLMAAEVQSDPVIAQQIESKPQEVTEKVSLDDFFQQQREDAVVTTQKIGSIESAVEANAPSPKAEIVAIEKEVQVVVPLTLEDVSPRMPEKDNVVVAEEAKAALDLEMTNAAEKLPIMPKEPAGFHETDNIVIGEDGMHLADYLRAAEVQTVVDGAEAIASKWNGDRFSSPGLGANADVKLIEQSYEGSLEKVIYVRPLEHAVRRIQFKNVVAHGTKLEINYGIDDASVLKDTHPVVYMKVWVGSKMLKRVLVFNERGFKKEVINLGPASFLQTPITVTFDVSADDVTKRDFGFYAKFI